MTSNPNPENFESSPLSPADTRKLLESALAQNLELTYEQRIDAHENARQLMIDLKKAGEDLRAKS